MDGYHLQLFLAGKIGQKLQIVPFIFGRLLGKKSHDRRSILPLAIKLGAAGSNDRCKSVADKLIEFANEDEDEDED